MSKMSATEAFVTLATTDAYCMGAIVVARSLRRHGTTRRIVAMVSPNVSRESWLGLKEVFDEVLRVDVLTSRDEVRLSWLGRPELGVTFTKLHCWTLTHYSKCVFLDADTLVLCNVDELFEREELSAAPDPGWPDCFNTGVFVFRPSMDTHAKLLQHARQHGSFDGGDQGLLNTFFSRWAVNDISKHLPFVYNLSASTVYTYLPAFQQYGHEAKIVHFLGPNKPWNSDTQVNGNANSSTGKFFSLWWEEFCSQPYPTLSKQSLRETPRKPQHSQPRETKAPFEENLDSSKSLLAHFSTPTESLYLPASVEETPLQPETMLLVDQQVDVVETETQDPPSSEEGSEGTDTATDADKDTEHVETEEEQLQHRQQWEAGRADYLGKDAFDNIQRKLDKFLN